MKQDHPKVAIVHDWLYGGGAELVVEQLHAMFPDAPIYTSFCSPEWRERLDNTVVTGYLDKWPFTKLHRFLPVLRQRWFKKLNLSDFDLVISSSGNGEAKFVTIGINTTHVCYCHTPTHFYWRQYNTYLQRPSFRPKWLARLGLKLLVRPLRKQDYRAAQRVDYFIANSSHIQNDIRLFYNRDSIVIHPPVNVTDFRTTHHSLASLPRPGFVIWGRHVPAKRFDLAIKACNQLGLALTVIGTGPATSDLKKIAGPTITFTGFATHENLVRLAREASAFIFPGEEDFGISPVEAMSLGLPVIAYKSGGALDYIVEAKTGLFFNEQSVNSLSKALASFDPKQFRSDEISNFAKQFSQANFQKNIRIFLKSKSLF